jgi:NADH-quinone oxidoreductase subunit A
MLIDYSLLLGLFLVAVAAIGFIWLSEYLIFRFSLKLSSNSGVLKTSLQPAWRRYHVRYYIFALLFLAFDMEMAFMYPWAVVFVELGFEAFADMGVFLIVLFMGLLYAWSQGGLKRQ